MTLFYIHWHEMECVERTGALRRAGHTVRPHWSTSTPPALGKDDLPDALVISLDRLPSHGRQVAAWLWEAKKRQHIPIVFEGGAPDKTAAARKQFPKAVFCATGAVAAALEGV